MRICFLNGKFIPEDQANISIFDRGFLFSDGVYEVTAVFNFKLVDNHGHLQRLNNSLKELGIKSLYSIEEIIELQKELIKKNKLENGSIYLQITRGVESNRDFLPQKDTTPTFLLIPQHKQLIDNPIAKRGVKLITLPEIRWAKRNIKSIGLLASVLAKRTAKERGYDDALFVEDGYITEGSSNNIFIVKNNTLISKKANQQILNGITRKSIIKMANKFNLKVEERDFNIDEIERADEAFISSATMLIVGVIQINNSIIGNGKPGKYTKEIRKTYIEMAQQNLIP